MAQEVLTDIFSCPIEFWREDVANNVYVLDSGGAYDPETCPFAYHTGEHLAIMARPCITLVLYCAHGKHCCVATAFLLHEVWRRVAILFPSTPVGCKVHVMCFSCRSCATTSKPNVHDTVELA